MAGTIEKIKAKVDNVLHKDKTHDDPTGPHSSHSANKADPRVDSDRIGTTGNTAGAGGVGTGQYGAGHGTTGHSTTGGLTGSSTTGGYGTTGHSDPTGPHDSRLANKADPRVDSDRIGTAGNTSSGFGTGHGTTGHSTTGHGTTGGLTGSSTTGGYGTTGHSDPTGPHDSRLANKADPRVDSDRIGTAGNTSSGFGTGHGTTGHSTTGHGTTGGLTGSSTTGGYGSTGHSDPTGPHDSKLANKLDPRVDNTSSGFGTGHGTTGHSTTGHGTTGGLTGSSTTGGYGSTGYSDPTGPHDSRLGNKADPRVDSDRIGGAGNTYGTGHGTTGGLTGHGTTGHGTTGHGTTGGLTGSSTTGAYNNTPGSGNSNKTAGPHNSDMLNKVDPRVDSDLDGSKTYGGNQTYQ